MIPVNPLIRVIILLLSGGTILFGSEKSMQEFNAQLSSPDPETRKSTLVDLR